MSFSRGMNATHATLTRSRTPGNVSPFSGLCATCLEGCTGLCEVGRSAIRCREVIYPQPFGTTTSASEKDYPVDFSHFNIMGTTVGAHGIAADSDVAIFSNVDIASVVAKSEPIKLKYPVTIPAIGSTNVARDNWEGLAVGSAISGIILTIGENICGMDPEAEFKNGKVVHSPAMEKRVRLFQEWYNGYGAIAVQCNVEDTRLGVQEYVINKLGVTNLELKWGQGAKDIGGEVKLPTLERALQLKERGYIVHPDPELPEVQEAYRIGSIKEFERHARIGMVEKESFIARVQQLRELGAKNVYLKTGAYRPADLARAVKYASEAHIDVLTVDGAGGGTGMSPWRMMNEWGVPTVYLESLLYQYLNKLAAKGAYIPSVVIAGGFALEDHVFKGIALGAPYVKAVGMARAPIAAAMVGKTIGNAVKGGKIPSDIAKYGSTVEQIFVISSALKREYGDQFKDIPPAAIAIYSYLERIGVGLRQFMCGARKFSLQYITRDDLTSLTPEAARVSGIPYVMDADAEEVERILEG